MNLFLIIFGLCILTLAVMSKIPGLEHLVKPIVDIFFKLVQVAFENVFAWIIFVLKGAFFCHISLFQNLIKDANELDPTVEIEEQSE